jgi:hypothetical protein
MAQGFNPNERLFGATILAAGQRARETREVADKAKGLFCSQGRQIADLARLRAMRFGEAAFAMRGLAEPQLAKRAKAGGGRRTRTFEVIRRLIYSQLPLPLGTLPRPNSIGTTR